MSKDLQGKGASHSDIWNDLVFSRTSQWKRLKSKMSMDNSRFRRRSVWPKQNSQEEGSRRAKRIGGKDNLKRPWSFLSILSILISLYCCRKIEAFMNFSSLRKHVKISRPIIKIIEITCKISKQ